MSLTVRSFFGLLGLLVILPTFARAQGIEPDAPLALSTGEYFEVLGTDRRSASYVAELGEHVVEICGRYLIRSKEPFPNRIFVTLRPEDRVDFEGPYRIRLVERGGVNLDFRWVRELQLETVVRALAEAYLLRYGIYNFGSDVAETLPAWVVSALGAETYLKLRPAQYLAFADQALTEPLPELANLLDQPWSAATGKSTPSRAGYWFLSALQQSGFRRRTLADLVDYAIRGEDLRETLVQLLQPLDTDAPPVKLGDWWQGRLMSLLSVNHEVNESLSESRSWLDALSDLSTVPIEDPKIENFRSLWTHRNDEGLRKIVRARNELLRLRIPRVNPAYFNAARSLGALFEVVLEGEYSHEFIAALTVFLSDWEDSKRLEQQVMKLLEE